MFVGNGCAGYDCVVGMVAWSMVALAMVALAIVALGMIARLVYVVPGTVLYTTRPVLHCCSVECIINHLSLRARDGMVRYGATAGGAAQRETGLLRPLPHRGSVG